MTTLFTLTGKVKTSLQRGRKLGYPTANLEIEPDTPEGIFIAHTILPNGEKRPSLLFVGSALTFNETEKKGEVFILDYKEDVYGQQITVEALQKLRDNEKFDSAEELITQMKKDEADARQYFRNLENK